ncbi:hypothetical protein ACFWHT_12370 [Microbacterium sp. NPDC058342]|uniref:hypothetical protein n=1 Tax=Microbacterium sp. NPDC058342 TaxID=3346454 RepID=UPI003657FF7A
MSGIGDQGMMPEHVQSQHPDDDTVDERVAAAGSGDRVDGDAEVEAEQTEVDEALAGISDDERADAARMARRIAQEPGIDTRSQRNP